MVCSGLTTSRAQHIERLGTHSSGQVFTSEIGTPLRPSMIQRAWSLAAGTVDTDATLHSLRHYFATVQIRGASRSRSFRHCSAFSRQPRPGIPTGTSWDEDDRSQSVVQEALGNLADTTRTVDGV
jgi:hypothetical protein